MAIVHNGIIENYKLIKKNLNCKYRSETDTEVFVNLIANQSGQLLQKILAATKQVVGSFAFALLEKSSNKIFVGKRYSPLYVAQDKNGCMAASDISVLAGRYECCYALEDDEYAELNQKNIIFFDKNGKKIEKNAIFIKNFNNFEQNENEKYLMMREIKEQPFVLRRTFYKFFSEDNLNKKMLDQLRKFKAFHIIACGTAYHAALLGVRFIEELYHKPAQASIASEFRYNQNVLSKNTLYIFVSQSGETADTIACAKLIKDAGLKALCITNVEHSTLNKYADFLLPTFAGKETAVASTKAYCAQLTNFLILASKLADHDLQNELKDFVLRFEINMFDEKLLAEIMNFKKIYFMGRGQDFVSSLEAALKLKEIAYVNCWGIAAGELKHGTLALVDEQTLVIAISTQKNVKEKIEANIAEVKARGGKVLLVSNFEHEAEVDYQIKLPNFDEIFMPVVSIVPLQLLAFEYSKAMGINPDKPRNLAKSVTVE